MSISIEAHLDAPPTREHLDAFFEILRSHNRRQVGESGFKKLTLLLRDETGKVLGGLDAHTYYGWMFVENLAVDESIRGSGWGGKLLEAAHAEALRRDCKNVWLDTFSFQALPFYQKMGYTLFGTLDDFPPGHKRYFLQRSLA